MKTFKLNLKTELSNYTFNDIYGSKHEISIIIDTLFREIKIIDLYNVCINVNTFHYYQHLMKM